MSEEIKIKVPDIGGANGVDVIEIQVKPGDTIEVDSPLITLESDKASMEIPSPKAGKVKSLSIKVGDKVSEGDDILLLITEHNESKPVEMPQTAAKKEEPEVLTAVEQNSNKSEIVNVNIPDIGGATDVDVIDILVKLGDEVEKDQALITLEGDKATMDIPSPTRGRVESIEVQLGDKVSQGTAILKLRTVESGPSQPTQVKQEQATKIEVPVTRQPSSVQAPEATLQLTEKQTTFASVYAGPAVRRMAREFGVNLELVKGTGRKGRICKEDVQGFIKARMTEKNSATFLLPAAPTIDFSKFGSVEVKSLNKIKRLTGVNVHRSWVTIPHVTQFDEADITELEAFRKSEADKSNDYKLTLLAFVTKVVAKALAVYPQFNTSLDASGENLIYKHYYNIGIAVETANGLVVPVIKNVDKLSVSEIAKEMAIVSKKAREKGLQPADMSGGCFTISSLGGIGGTAFTPIVNSPEVAILGLSRSSVKPVYSGNNFQPRLMLPLSLSYDHRVIDGAEAARFTRFIAESLSDIRRILL